MKGEPTPAMAQRDAYVVVEWNGNWDPSLRDLLAVLPELVIGKRVAITSCDSGAYRPTEDQQRGGWEVSGAVAVSPILREPEELPMPGFDEWYVFAGLPVPTLSLAFVNTFGFSPLAEGSPDTEAFWRQVHATQPLHVLGAGTPNMFLVTKDAVMAERAAAIDMVLS